MPAFATTTGAANVRAVADVQAAAFGVNWYESAPYYSTLDSSAPDLGQVMAATGQKAFEMAFILAGGGCGMNRFTFWRSTGTGGATRRITTAAPPASAAA